MSKLELVFIECVGGYVMGKIGLTEKQVIENRKKYGSNELYAAKRNSFLKLLIESFGDPIIKILLIALAIKIVFLFRSFDWFETLGILIAIFLASFISSISEYGSEKAFSKLQEESSKIKAKVKRDNQIKEVIIDEVVVNDIVYLSTGDKLPADGYLISGKLSVNESALNGEAKEQIRDAVINSKPTDKNKVYRGSVIYEGQAIMKVTSVGNETIYGALAEELTEHSPESPLKIRLRHLAKIISRIGYVGAFLAVVSYLFSVIIINNNFNTVDILNTVTNFHVMFEHFIYALTLCVTVIVVAVPEGLPMMITLVLSYNMKRMLRDNVLVRKMVGIETAGSLNVLLTDKTGTLTKGVLEVTGIKTSDLKFYNNLTELNKHNKLQQLIRVSLIYNNNSRFDENGNAVGGNITDKSLLTFAKGKTDNKVKLISQEPFNSTRKYSKAIIEKDNKQYVLYKGASEKILHNCTYYYNESGLKRTFRNKENVKKDIEKYTSNGIRVITLAIKDTVENSLNNLIFLGFVLIKDELRDEAKEALELVKKAGIQTIMITGDAKETAVSIGNELNLLESNDIILTSDELELLSNDEIKDNFKNIKIVARALPSDKSRLVRIAQELKLVVGMTGDGVNDAPALKKCDVGFAMGSGTEVSKEAADIVILDNNFLSIAKAILYGRTIFKSIRKFIIFQLTVNICALILSILGPFIGIDTPITIIQMLWINMIMDTFAGIAFAFEPPLLSYMEEKPKTKNEPIINKYMANQIAVTGLYSAFLCLLFLKHPFFNQLIRVDVDGAYLMTAYFALFIFIEIFNAFNTRTERLNLLANLSKNKAFILIISFIITVQLAIIYFGGDMFRTYGLTKSELLLTIVLASTILPVDWIRKLMLKKLGKTSSV